MTGLTDRRVELVDVARHAGVAASTASNALNGRGRVSADTRRRVRESARELGYLPNPAARGLRVGRSRLIGVALRMYLDEPDHYPSDIYYGQLITACTTAASRRGYAVALLPEYSLHVAEELPLAAIIVTDTSENDPAVEHAYTLGIPVITDYRPGDTRAAAVVDVDTGGTVVMVNDHLLSKGAKRIGLLSVDPTTTSFATQWNRVHADWCARNSQALVVETAPSAGAEPMEAAVSRLLDAGCDAVVCIPIGSGQVVLETARSRSLTVPGDVMVVAVDENPDLAGLSPPLTTVGLDPVATAVQGTNLIIDLLEGKTSAPAELLISSHLNERESTLR